MTAGPLPGLDFLCTLPERWPLARWEAWPEGPHGTSQQRAVRGMGTEITAKFGGVRSGKTAADFEIDLAHALGGDHPAVIAWMARNRIPWTIPPGPGRVWVVAATSNDSIRIHRPHFVHAIPEELADWYNVGGRGEARVFIHVPGYAKPAEIWFKSADQPVKSFKGDAVRLCHFDEEPPEDRWDEASLRTGYNGTETLRMLLSMQPEGMTWVHTEIVEKGEKPSVQCHWLDSMDNTALPDVVRAQLKRKFDALPEARRKARQKGLFIVREGLVYPTFRRDIHVVAPFEIPEDWPRFVGMDFGWKTSAVVFAALSPDGDVVIYDEHYQGGLNLSDHSKAIKGKADYNEETGRGNLTRGWGDPREVQQCAEMAKLLKIKFRVVPERSVSLGIDEVTFRLAIDEGRKVPGMTIFGGCHNLLWEMGLYHWQKEKDAPVKKNDHAVDALRYLVVGIAKWSKRRYRTGRGGIDSGAALRQQSKWKV